MPNLGAHIGACTMNNASLSIMIYFAKIQTRFWHQVVDKVLRIDVVCGLCHGRRTNLKRKKPRRTRLSTLLNESQPLVLSIPRSAEAVADEP